MVVKIAPTRVPPLENGDHLTRDEFERRYEVTPVDFKAELIEGIVYVASPKCHTYYGGPLFHAAGWLGHYEAFTPGTNGSINATIRLDLDNEPQPDVCLFIDPAKGGQAFVDEDDLIANAPELVLEVSASTISIDTKKKLPVYLRNKVQEYIVWRVYDDAIDWYVLRGSSYEQIATDEAGIRKSETFPGLWLDSAAFLRGDMVTAFGVLQRGLASPEHAAFLKRLNG